ncbi:MAG TPA: homoserine dehydrogenase [Actinomycetota bacterium]|nr:homoserine dehydrogenase [Actinomycetota bacterium]
MAVKTIRVGMLGCGTVGAATIRLLDDHGADIERRVGCRLEVTRVAVRNAERPRDVPLAAAAFTDDPHAVIRDPDVDVIAELIGGIEPARSLILEAIGAGKHVVTANKELLSTLGRELFDAAESAGVDVGFEAAVGAGIPLILPLRESLAGERISRILGIVNGTTNYVLTRMTEDGLPFADALAQAERLGYAERDPSADIEGFDAAAKCAILASLAFNASVVAGDVYREGIAGLQAEDVEFATRLGYVVKLLAIAEMDQGEVAVRVHPAMIPKTHPLAAVRESFNAVFVEGAAAGELMFYGRGAGGRPTASAVLGDLIDAAHNLRAGGSGRTAPLAKARTRPIDEMSWQFYLDVAVADRPGVLAAVAAVFGEHQVSIRSMEQFGLGAEARLVFITHTARERDMQATISGLRHLDAVERIGSFLRVVGPE